MWWGRLTTSYEEFIKNEKTAYHSKQTKNCVLCSHFRSEKYSILQLVLDSKIEGRRGKDKNKCHTLEIIESSSILRETKISLAMWSPTCTNMNRQLKKNNSIINYFDIFFLLNHYNQWFLILKYCSIFLIVVWHWREKRNSSTLR